MKERCDLPSHHAYKHYGERQITYCAEWSDFSAFLCDMGERPDGTTLDRKNVNDDYYKDNCQWSDPVAQSRNRRNNVPMTYDGRTMPVSAWAEESGIPYATLLARKRMGWDDVRALTTPVQIQKIDTHTYDGRTMTTAEWAREKGIACPTLRYRLKRGWSFERAITTPVA